MDILSKVDDSDWTSPTVYMKKKSKDFSTGLNDALKSYHYPLPRAEDTFAQLSRGRIFSKIDLSDEYLLSKVDDECSKLLTINTHRGIFKFNRLEFGIKVTQAIFQQVMNKILSGLDVKVAYLDDILLISKNTEEYKKNVFEVFRRIQVYGFKLKDEKGIFLMNKIKELIKIINKTAGD